MVILQESPWYQQIFRESEKRGERRAILSILRKVRQYTLTCSILKPNIG